MFGYFRRVKNSFVGVIVGIALVPGSVALHAWNEYRTVHRTRGLAEAEELVQTIADTETESPELDQQLVHMSGLADTQEVLRDDEFFVHQRSIRLARRAEMYQWTERRDKDRNDSNKTPRYEYKQDWEDEWVNSSGFHQTNGHINPEMKFLGQSATSESVNIGVYQLDRGLVGKMNFWTPVEIPADAIFENLSEAEQARYIVRGNELYIGSETAPDPTDPRIGDQRIHFEAVLPMDVSLAAQLRGNTFGEFRTSNGEPIYSLYQGNLSAADVMTKLETENTVFAWILRAVGFGICVAGFAMILRPLSALVSFIPFAEQLTGGLFFVVALMLGSALSLVTIGVSWIAVRPVLGIALLAAAAAGMYLIHRIRKSSSDTPVASPEIIDADMV